MSYTPSDLVPTNNSINNVESNGVYDAIAPLAGSNAIFTGSTSVSAVRIMKGEAITTINGNYPLNLQAGYSYILTFPTASTITLNMGSMTFGESCWLSIKCQSGYNTLVYTDAFNTPRSNQTPRNSKTMFITRSVNGLHII